ncbi:unnamed protein product, partial [Mesorhabditis spiculigera]
MQECVKIPRCGEYGEITLKNLMHGQDVVNICQQQFSDQKTDTSKECLDLYNRYVNLEKSEFETYDTYVVDDNVGLLCMDDAVESRVPTCENVPDY